MVVRDRLDGNTLRLAFTRTDSRTQRISDGTVVIDTRRFEVPNPYRLVLGIEPTQHLSGAFSINVQSPPVLAATVKTFPRTDQVFHDARNTDVSTT